MPSTPTRTRSCGELISNASDALDKLRIESLRNKELAAKGIDTSDLHIEIEVDQEARTPTVRDNGIGMTRAEIVELIGTLSKLGTAELRQQLRDAKTTKKAKGTKAAKGAQKFIGPPATYRAELLTGDARAAGWATSVDFYRGYESYRANCAPYEIRIFRLRRAAG